ncbi:MAG TPA: hypothetical protein VM364_17370 [Vicinamibacterales bacterium]|nr:hypothetical protein [Vicinamibacterales bacterium]
MAARIRGVLSAVGRLKRASTAWVARGVQTVGCTVCFQNVESPLLDSARVGVLSMAILVVIVLGTFGAWFRRLGQLEQEHQATAGSGMVQPRPGDPPPNHQSPRGYGQ